MASRSPVRFFLNSLFGSSRLVLVVLAVKFGPGISNNIDDILISSMSAAWFAANAPLWSGVRISERCKKCACGYSAKSDSADCSTSTMFSRRAADLESFGGAEIPCLSFFLKDAIPDFHAESIDEWYEVDSQNEGTYCLP
jgi:hypothetical protein